jgi:glycosyltransferase involved in cell wall biosynthesis
MSDPTISVLLSNYNYGKYLPQCLAGILRQSFRDFEVVITDDGSTDGSQAILRDLASRDDRIKPTYFEKNQGAMAATKHNMERARGRLIFGEGVDDFIIDKEFFKNAVEGLVRHPDAAGFFAQAALLSIETNTPVGMIGMAPREGYWSPAEFYPAFLRAEMFVPGASSIWRRECMRAVGEFDYSLGPQTDYLINHLLPAKYGVVYARVPVACQRIYQSAGNYGSRGDLWEMAARYASVEAKLKAAVPEYPEMEKDWAVWRARTMIDAISKTTGMTWVLMEPMQNSRASA